jgi:peptidoglycan/xylan/chitin deacetylase (PgdA/CDA1 family)
VKSVILKFANLLGETGIYRLLCPGRIPVFMLHRVTDGNDDDIPGDMTADMLRGYLRYLASRGYRVLTMEQLWRILDEGKAIPSKSVMFTIDDGFSDHHDVAASVFDEFGFPLNFFVITGLLDQQLWPWDDQIAYALNRTEIRQVALQLPSGDGYSIDLTEKSTRQTIREIRNALKTGNQAQIYNWLGAELYSKLEVTLPGAIPREYRPMSWDDARSLRARGHGVYPHTCSHRILSALSSEEKHREINEARQRVERELEFTPEVFAYPTGRPSDYDAADIEELKQAGFKMAFNTVPDYVRHGHSHYELPRFSLPETTADFLQIVNRFEALKEKVPVQSNFSRNFLPTR